MENSRRSFIKTIGSAIALVSAPAIVRAEWLMPVVRRNDWAYLMTCLKAGIPMAAGQYTINRALRIGWGDWSYVMPPDVSIRSRDKYLFIFGREDKRVISNISFDCNGGLLQAGEIIGRDHDKPTKYIQPHAGCIHIGPFSSLNKLSAAVDTRGIPPGYTVRGQVLDGASFRKMLRARH